MHDLWKTTRQLPFRSEWRINLLLRVSLVERFRHSGMHRHVAEGGDRPAPISGSPSRFRCIPPVDLAFLLMTRFFRCLRQPSTCHAR